MAETNEISNVYISDLDGNNVIYMDIDPVPFPFISVPKRKTSSIQCVCGIDDTGKIVSGQTIHKDSGSTLQDLKPSWRCQYCIEATKTALESKYNSGIKDILFSYDDGKNIYQAQWDEEGLIFPRDPGRTSYNLEIHLKMVDKV